MKALVCKWIITTLKWILLNPYNPKILCVFKIRYEVVFVCLLDEISMKQHSCLGCALIVKSMDPCECTKGLKYA